MARKRSFQPPIIEKFLEQRIIRQGAISKTIYCVVLCKDEKTYAFIEHLSKSPNDFITGYGGFGWFCLDDERQREANDLIVESDFLQDNWREIAKMADDLRDNSRE